MKLGILLLTITLAGYAQPAGQLKYEVSSIRPNTDSDSGLAFQIEPDGTLAATGITLARLMMTAFNVQGFRIVAGPAGCLRVAGMYRRSPTGRRHSTKSGQCSEPCSKTAFSFVPIQRDGRCQSMN
jgi:hypothetical protein